MFLDIATSDLSTAFDIRYVAVATGGVVLQFALAWAAGWLLCPDRSKQSAFSHAAYRGNFVYLGTALLRNIYGVSHVPSATLILALVIPLYNIQGVVLMTVKERQGRFQPVHRASERSEKPHDPGCACSHPLRLFQDPAALRGL